VGKHLLYRLTDVLEQPDQSELAMHTITFEELITPDERSLLFTPMGLSPGGAMRAEDALEHHQATISRADLIPDIPEPVQRNFERFRAVHTYGVLLYDLFTIVDDFSVFVLEQALGHRLLERYDGELPLTDPQGNVHPLEAEWFEQVHEQMHDEDGIYFRKPWWLPGTVGKDRFRFTGNLTNLLKWARWEGFLRGQANRQAERAFVDQRNRAAHPTGHHLVGPVDSAPTIRDLAEIINHLWGATTEGGRLYPPPRRRDILAISWTSPERSWSTTLAHNLSPTDDDDATYLLVRGDFRDERLFEFATDFEETLFPTDWLWGPGPLQEALAWLEWEKPSPDHVDPLDRPFLVEVREGTPQRPRRPEALVSLSVESESDWFLLLADIPLTAFNHVRNVLSSPKHSKTVCADCNTETIAIGKLEDVMQDVEQRYGRPQPIPMRGIAVPRRW
jgi:hypothetical protein